LTRKNTFYCRYGVFKVRVAGFTTQHAHERNPSRADGLSKLNSVHAEVDVRSRRALPWTALRPSPPDSSPEGRTAEGGQQVERLPEYKSSGIPRKEVIQPQLPLRLPCYDFTPIINPTFDGCLLRRG